MPKIVSSSEIYATTLASGPFGSEVKIAGILGDQQAAMVGQVCFDAGESKTTYGTGNFALVNTGTNAVRSSHGLLTTVLFKLAMLQPTTHLKVQLLSQDLRSVVARSTRNYFQRCRS